MDIMTKLAFARGDEVPELVLKNVNIVDVYTETTYTADVAINDNIIVGIGDYQGKKEVDLSGKYVCPGFIDGHVHIESSMVTPQRFAKAIVSHGTTTVIADPHEIANVAGLEGVKYMIEDANNAVIDIKFVIPSCVPVSDMDIGGAALDVDDMKQLIGCPEVVGLGEVMSFYSAINGDKDMLSKMELFDKKVIDGHGCALTGKPLQAYRMSGVMNDHECTSYEEALERLRTGFYILARNGSAARNVKSILTGMYENNIATDRIVMCTDDKHLDTIAAEGHISHNIRLAMEIGYKPETAIKMATLNAANLYKLEDRGAIAVGKRADIVILDDLKSLSVKGVITNGAYYDKSNAQNIAMKKVDVPNTIANSVTIKEYTASDLSLVVQDDFPVINIVPGEIVTRLTMEKLPVDGNGEFVPTKELLKMVVIHRHSNSDKIAVGAVRGFGFSGGAFGSTIAHDSHNMIIVGDSDEAILLAAKQLKAQQGGYILVDSDGVRGRLELPIAGLMTADETVDIHAEIKKLSELAYKYGVPSDIDAFQNLSFVSLTVIPEVRLTDNGVYTFADNKYWK